MENKNQLRNTLLLVFAALIWGTAFVAQSVGSGYMGPYTFLAGRSWLACAFLLGLMGVRRVGQHRKGVRLPFWLHGKTLVIGGALCGVVLFAASAAQQMGIGTTSTAKAGFMTALYVVLVPVCGIFLGSRPGPKLWACVAVSVVGLYLLCLAGEVDAPIGMAEGSILARAVRPDGLPARTRYQVLKRRGNRTLVRLELVTGRTHQVRVHMAYLGCPLAGDFLYGVEDPDLIGRPALHSWRLEVRQPVTGERLTFQAALPEDMARLMA